jgi:hypothetical protein
VENLVPRSSNWPSRNGCGADPETCFQGAVYLDGAIVDPFAWSDTSVTVELYGSVGPGAIELRVEVGGRASNEVEVIVLDEIQPY